MSTAMRQPEGGSPGNRRALALNGRFLLFTGLVVLLVLALTAVDGLALVLRGGSLATQPDYYVSLGDSLAYGFQPDLNFTAGYSDDLAADLRSAGVTDVVNYACGGESTTTMIHGGCTGRVLKHDPYFGAQLNAAVSFLNSHRGKVGYVTLIIGANDVINDWDQSTCQPSPRSAADLATMDTNLTQTILPALTNALHPPMGLRATHFVMLNYYDPFAQECPDSAAFIQTFDDHLASDAARFRIPIVDVYAAFGGSARQAANICAYTWICSRYHDVHPTTQGYRVIANAVENVLGTSGAGPGVNPPPILATPPSLVTPVSAQ